MPPPPRTGHLCAASNPVLRPGEQLPWFSAQVARRNGTNGQAAKKQRRLSKRKPSKLCRNNEEGLWNWDFRQPYTILQANLVIYMSVSVCSHHGLSALAKLYKIQGIKISGLPHLSLFTIPNNWIEETNQNELMRCVACLGLFLESPSPLRSWVLAPLCQAAELGGGACVDDHVQGPHQLPLHTPHFV